MTSIHTTRRAAAIIAAALALGASATPASARTFAFNSNGSLVQQSVSSTPAVHSSTPRGSDFETVDVAIGGGAAGLALLGIGGTVAVRRRRERQRTTRRSTIVA